MKLLMNPLVPRMVMLLFAGAAAFVVGLVAMRRLRKSLAQESEAVHHEPLAPEGLPVHAYHVVIQQLKQQKQELAAQQLAERRKAKVSDTLSSTILSSLSCGVLFLNTGGLVRQANAAARQLLGFASPVGLHFSDLFRTATLRPEKNRENERTRLPAASTAATSTVEQALAPALAGASAVRGLLLNYFTRNGGVYVLEVTASPVLGEDATLMGTTLVITDKTDLERIRHDQKMYREVSSELAEALRASLGTIAGYAKQLSRSRDPELAQLGDGIARETAQLDETVSSFVGEAEAASTSS